MSVNTSNIKMKDPNEVFDLLKVWHFLKTNNIVWPSALIALEDRINELLEPKDEWKDQNNVVNNGQ